MDNCILIIFIIAVCIYCIVTTFVTNEMYTTSVLRDTPDTMRNASSVLSGGSMGKGFGRGRLDSPVAWSAENNTIGEWYQIDNGKIGKITGIAIKGRADANQWVKTFKVQSKGSDGLWVDVDNGKIYTGNTDNTTQVDVTFDTPVDARYIGIGPQTWNGHMSMRVDIVSDATNTDKIVKIKDVSYNGHNSSGNFAGDAMGTGSARGRLDSPSAWSAPINVIGQWYELNLDNSTTILGVAMKGDSNNQHWVKKIQVEYMDSNDEWELVDDGYIYEGNLDNKSQTNIFFETPIKSKSIRIYPQDWNGHMSMRVGLMTNE